MRTIRVKSEEEFTTLVNNYDFRIVEAIVEGALSNLKTKKRFIHNVLNYFIMIMKFMI